MTDDKQLPNITGGRAGPRKRGEDRETAVTTVEYLSYGVLQRRGWHLDDDDLFEKAAAADLDDARYGTVDVEQDSYLLDSVEEHGLSWPFECRAASCANCCAYLVEGDLEMDMNLFLTDEEVEEMAIRLTCVGRPKSDDVRVVFDARRSEYLQTVVGQREV